MVASVTSGHPTAKAPCNLTLAYVKGLCTSKANSQQPDALHNFIRVLYGHGYAVLQGSLPYKSTYYRESRHLAVASTSGLTPSSQYYFLCSDHSIVNTSFHGDLLLYWFKSLILHNDHTMILIWCYDELLEALAILALHILHDISPAASL